MKPYLAFILLAISCLTLSADGPKDNIAEDVRPIPPVGLEIPDEVRESLEAGLQELGDKVRSLKEKKGLERLIPDVEIYHKAVRYILEGQQFYRKQDFGMAGRLLKQGSTRADALLEGNSPWIRQKGLVVRGYRSKIDGDVQPYGLEIPQTYNFDGALKHRLDFWFHGRGERVSEAHFIHQRQSRPGQFKPADTLVLHPYGRYSCANKFAGEIDLFECLEAAQQDYRIDEDRILVRGFSMGGAACWQFAVHYADRWCAAAPGAGFSETPDFLRTFQGETLNPTWYERKLWHLYDCTDWAINLRQLPTIAYSGEKDRQKQAADMMEAALEKEGIDLVHIIGKGMGHKYDQGSRDEIERRLASIAKVGRNRMPLSVEFTTWTLRYNKMHWIRVDGLEEHWERARVSAKLVLNKRVEVTTSNVSAFSIVMDPGHCPLEIVGSPVVVVDGKEFPKVPGVMSDRSWEVHFAKDRRGKWMVVESLQQDGLRKRHGLQGPIDDAFMDSFLMVMPTGEYVNQNLKSWVDAERQHAVDHWRLQFRGDCRVKDDISISDEDIANHNLVLWGTPSSNAVLGKISKELPSPLMEVFSKAPTTNKQIPVLIYPNPLNPDRYVVVNSGFTYRQYDYLNNARQVPKLPDWAVVDTSFPTTSRYPGKIIEAGFFDEMWRKD